MELDLEYLRDKEGIYIFNENKEGIYIFNENEVKGCKNMALETLRNVEKIDGYNVVVMDELREKFPGRFNESGGMDYKWFEKEIRPYNYMYIRHDVNSISFTIQNGTVKENGVNGCQIDTMVATCIQMLKGLNSKIPCRENSIAITKLQEAYFWLKERKRERESRGVEGLQTN